MSFVWIGRDEGGSVVWEVGSKRTEFSPLIQPIPWVRLGLPISLNSADARMLETVSGLGPVRSASIVEYRSMHGCFAHVRDLIRVHGIGPKTVLKVAPFLRIDGFQSKTCASLAGG